MAPGAGVEEPVMSTTTSTDEATTAHALSSSEAVLWAIERDPTLRSTIVVVALLAQPPDLSRLRERLASAARAVPRLRQRIQPRRTGVPRWVDAGHVDFDHHLRRVQLPPPGSLADVLHLAGQQAGEAFDDARPLWQMTVVEGLDDGRAAVVMRVHHSVTDGVGGVGLLTAFTDPEPWPSELGATSPGDRETSCPVPSGSGSTRVRQSIGGISWASAGNAWTATRPQPAWPTR